MPQNNENVCVKWDEQDRMQMGLCLLRWKDAPRIYKDGAIVKRACQKGRREAFQHVPF